VTTRQTPGLSCARFRVDRPAHLIRDGRTLCGHPLPKGVRPRKFTDQGQVDCYQCRRSKLFRYVDGIRVKIGDGTLTCLGCGFCWRPRIKVPKECPNCKARTGLGVTDGRVS